MTLQELTNYVTQKSQQVQPNDVAAAQMFVSKRYELIYQSYLWKDSLVIQNVLFDPANNPDNAEGFLLLPQVIDRVVAIRTQNNSVRINNLETYYRVDYDAFQANNSNYWGCAAEFAILSPVWFIWRGKVALGITTSIPDAQVGMKIRWRDTNGIAYVQTLNSTNQLLSMSPNPWGTAVVTAGSITSDDDSDAFKNGVLTSGTTYYWQKNGDVALGSGHGSYTDSGYFQADGSSINIVTANPDSAITSVIYEINNARIEVESVFKPITVGSITFGPTYTPITGAPDATIGGTLQAADTASPQYQRVRLFATPTSQIVVNVLGKRPFVPMTFPTEIPLIRNLDNCLIAFATADMWARARQLTKAQQFLTEGSVLLKELASLEAVQASNNSRFQPEGGYGDAYFGASGIGYRGLIG